MKLHARRLGLHGLAPHRCALADAWCLPAVFLEALHFFERRCLPADVIFQRPASLAVWRSSSSRLPHSLVKQYWALVRKRVLSVSIRRVDLQ